MFLRFPAIGWLLACCVLSTAQADDDDTRFLQDQTRRATEQQAQSEQQLAPAPGTLLYEGQVYQVQDEALVPAIYIAINSNQWAQLPEFLARYRQLPDHRPALVAMAESLLARFNGDYPQALQRMQAARDAEPEDVRIRLELARLWFEDNQDNNARSGFDTLLGAGLPPFAEQMVEQYRQALDNRAEWHGSGALGWGYNDNINQANGYHRCESYLALLGVCLFERVMPEAMGSQMVNYEVSLQKRINLAGNHNLQLRPLAYGNQFFRENDASSATIRDYSNNLALLQAGYQYLTARDSLALTPYLEHYYRNRHGDYLAHGLQAEWRRALDPRWQVSTSLDAKRYAYTDHGLRTGADYEQYQWGLSVAFMPAPTTSLYGGLTLTRKRYEVDAASSRDWSVRAGVYHLFKGAPGFYLNALGIYRDSRNEAYDGFLGARREDRQQVYILGAGASGWQVAGLTPELRVRHSINQSNLDWAFGYRQTEVSLMLRKDF